MKITTFEINNVLKLRLEHQVKFDSLGLIDSKNKKNILSFIDNEKFVPDIERNTNIKGIFVTKNISQKIRSKKIFQIIVSDPKWYFFTLYNYFTIQNQKTTKSIISSSAIISPSAIISNKNVKIGSRTIIEDGAIILEDVKIGKDCIIRSGSIVGSNGFEYKRTSKGVLPVKEDGVLYIRDNVEIGANSVIVKGFSYRNTIIGKDTKIDTLVNISHSVHVGNEVFIGSLTAVSGSVTIGNKVWIGPGSNISNSVNIGRNSEISIGSNVIKSVPDNQRVFGNPARIIK